MHFYTYIIHLNKILKHNLDQTSSFSFFYYLYQLGWSIVSVNPFWEGAKKKTCSFKIKK